MGYFVLCLDCICRSVDVSFRVTFCYDNLGVWYFSEGGIDLVSLLCMGLKCVSMMFL